MLAKFGVILGILFLSTLNLFGRVNANQEDEIKKILLLTKEGDFKKVEERFENIESFDKYGFQRDLKVLNRVLQNYEIPNSKEWIYEDLGNIEGLHMQTINLIFFDKLDTTLNLNYCSIEFLIDIDNNRIFNCLLKHEEYIDKNKLKKLNFTPIENYKTD
jgi:hypothetical protein